MNDATRILIIEDLVSDYELAQREIRKVVKNSEFKRVDDQETLLKALDDFQPDIIISDYNLPGFNGMDVMKLVHEYALLTPLIIWTGSISEDVAVECMKAGANNYVLKENIKRLGLAVVHALEERQLRMERRQAEEKFRVIFENSPVGIFQSTPDGRFISVNPAMARIYGYDSPGEMIQSIRDIASQIYIDPADRSEFTKLFETRDVVDGFEWKNVRKDGTVFWTSTSARAIRGESGQILCYEGFLQDITKRKEAEQALKNSESRFRGLTENGLDSISLLAADGTLLWVTPSMTRILDHNPENFLGRNMFELMHPEDKAWAYDLFVRLTREPGSREHQSFRLRHMDGTWRWVEAVVTNLLEEPGVNAIVVNYRDVTERKNAEKALQESEERFRLIAQNAEDILLTMDMDLRITYVSPSVERTLGYAAEEILSSTPERFLMPESYALGLKAFHEEVEKARSQPDPNYARLLEMEYCRKNGSTFWVEMKFSFFRDSDGRPTAILGVGRDITERKQAEDKLRESENHLIQALSTAQMSVWEWNLQTNDILWSPEFYAITGIEASGLEGIFEGYTDLIHPEDAARVRRAAEKAVVENVMFTEEFRIIRPDGELRWLANLGHAEYGRSNTSLRMIGTVQDITPRKQAEVERQALLEIMQGVAVAKDLHEFLVLIHRSIGSVIYAENFFVVIHHKDTGLFEEIYSVDQYDPPAPPSKLEKSITSYVFRTGEPVLMTQERFDELAAMGEVELVGTNSESWLGVPLKTPGGTIGVMVVQDYENQNRYSERDRNFLASIAAQVSLAIERKQAELELQQKNDDLALLNAVNEAVVQGQDLNSIVELLGRELKRIFSTQGNTLFSTIYMLSPDKQSILMRKYFLASEIAQKIEKLIGFSIPAIEIPLIEGGYFHKAMISRQSAITIDPQAIRGWITEFTETRSLSPFVRAAVRKLVPQIYKLLNINSMILVPLISKEEIIGFLDVSGSGLFTASDLKRIGNIGAQLTAVIQRQQANEKLHRSEKFLQSIQNALSASIAILNETGTIVQVNSAWREFGEQNGLVHPEYGVGLNYLDICDTARGADAEEGAAVAQAIRAVIAGQRNEARIEYPCHAPGRQRWFTLRITKFEDGDNTWVVLAHENITEQKLAEVTLIQSQARYQNLFDSSPVPLWEEDYSLVKQGIDRLLESGVADLESYLSSHPEEVARLASLVKVTDVNKASLELFRAKQKSDLLKDLILLWGQEGLSKFQEEILGLMSPLKRFSWEGPDHTLDGQTLEVIVNGSIPPGYENDWSKVIVSISDITQRKKAERALQQSENRYRTVVEHQTEFIVRWNPDGKRTFVNEAYCRYFGLTPEQALSSEFMPQVYEEDRLLVKEKISRLLSGAVKAETEIHRVVKPDGEIGWQEWTDQAIYDEDGNLIEVQSVGRDITARKRAEEAEHEQRALAEALRDTALTLNSTLEYGEVLDHILGAVGSVVPHDAATIMLIEGNSAHVVRSHGYDGHGTRDEILDYWLKLAQTPNLRKMVETGQPEIIHDTHFYNGWHRTTFTDWLRSNVGAPISIHGKVIGFILLDSATVGFFTTVHADRLVAFANQAALAIHNANVLQQAQDEIAERKRAEEKLRTSEERFRQMAENIEEVFWMTDVRTGRELYMSPACEKVWGRSSEYLMQVPNAFMDSILPEDTLIVQDGLRKEKNGEKVEMEYRIMRPDGSMRWVWDRAFPIFGEDGSVRTLAGIAADITERKQAEEALRLEKERSERIVATVPGIICSFRRQPDGSTSMPFASSIIEDIYGLKPEDVFDTTTPIFERIHPEDKPAILDSIDESARTMLPWQAEFRYFHPTKGEIWIEGKSMPVREPDGSMIWHGFITDVTERKQVEEKLRASEARYHSLFDNLVDGFALHEIITDDQGQPVDYMFLEVNPAFEKLTGLSAREVVGRPVTEVLTDSENERFIPLYGQVALTGQPIRFHEYSAHLDKHFDISAYSPGSRQFAVTFTDITERKKADEALRESEEKFSNAFEFAPIGIGLVSLEGRWLRVNRSLCNLLGYSDQELAAKTFQEITHPEDLASDLDNVNRLLAGEMPSYQMEKRYQHKSGEIVWVLLSVSILRDREGRPQYFLSQIQDITQRKRADQELRRRAEETSALLETSQALTNLDLNVILHSIGNSAKNLFTADGCRIFLMQPDGESLRCVLALQENFVAFSDLRVKLGEGVTGSVAASGRGEIVNEMQNDPRAVQVPGTEEEEEAIIFAPLKQRDRTIGVLSVRRAGSDRPFEQADLELLEAFASMAASAVSNARLFEETQRRLAELEALYENGLAVGQLLEPRQIGERIIETFARHLSWHHVAIRLVRPGTDELELIAFSQPGMSEAEQAEIEHHFNRMINRVGQGMSGWVVQTGKPIRTSNVNEYPQYVRTYTGIQSGLYMPLMVGERAIGVISVESEEADALTAQDERLLATLANQAAIAFENARLYQSAQQEIAERKRIENELRESRERYQLLIETSPDGIIMLNMDGIIQFSNQQMAGLFNIENPAELLGTHILSLFPPEEQIHIEQNMGNHKLEDGPQDGHWLMRRDGSRFYGELRSSTLRNERGEEYAIIAQLRDVTERKQSQEALQEERQRFLDLFENSPNPTWLEDFTAVVAWMDELRTLGIEDLGKYLHENPDEYRVGVSLIRILNVNHAAVIVNGARDKQELIDKVHELLLAENPSRVMIYELEMIWKGNTSFGFEMSSPRMDGTLITGIQRVYIPINNSRPDYARVIVTSTDITERVEIERKLRASELHYRELADSITDILFELDHDLQYTHWNKASEMLMGLPAYNAIGKSMYEVFGDSEEQIRIGNIYRSVLEENQPKTFETEIPINGQRLVFEINANPSMRGVSVVARNITERKLSETLMQKRFELVEYSAHHSFEKVLQKTIDMVSELTGSHIGFMHFVDDDQATMSLQAWSTETLREFCVAEGADMHYPVAQAGVWADAVRERRSIVQNDYESLPNKKGLPQGHARVTREMVIPIIRNERIVALLGMGNKELEYTRQDMETAERFADYAWDITERKQMESALAEERNQLAKRVEERTADLSRANSNLARALRVKDEFLANMSHELRTPLNAILGLSESLGEQVAGPLNEKQQKYLSTINESGHHLLALINDILDLAKIEAGQITLDINKVDINSVCQASLRMVKQLAQKKNQEVVFEIENDIGLMWADERRLKQMIVNLLSNAVKFTPETGQIGLEVHGDRAGNKVSITVWDTGIGIKEQDLERLFKPFVQLDSGLAREATGTGLGLALVAQMARLHGGSVHALSQPGDGSRFIIQLPWEPAMASDIVARLRNTGKFRAVDPSATRPTILLIEDTREVVMMLVDYLEMAGFKMVTAQDGIDGLEQAKLSHPDLILMDIQMPRMDGFEATQKLRSDPEFKDIPIIALTALAMPNDRQRCLDAGMDDYISKPVNLKTLAKMIQKLLFQDQEANPS